MQPNPQARWNSRTITLDCLNTSKHLATVDSFNVLESSSPEVHNAFARMAQDHVQLAAECASLAQQRGWYPSPPRAVHQHWQEVASQLQAADRSIQQQTGGQFQGQPQQTVQSQVRPQSTYSR